MKMKNIIAGIGVVCATLVSASSAQSQTFQKPFSSNSIWNKAIPSNATYVAANLGVLGAIANDREWIYQTSYNDPYRAMYQPQGWEKPGVYIPDNLLIPDEPNGCAAFLMPDGVTVREYNALSRTTAASTLRGYYYGDLNLNGDGLGGGHAGSGMSVLGGSIRAGELESSSPITHPLKIELDWAVLYRNPNSSNNKQETYRWPATNSDGNSADGYGNAPTYSGANSALRMGSLCALPKNIDVNNLGLSAYGRKIAKAFQDYGAYVVDSTGDHWQQPNGGYTMAICMQGNGQSNYFADDNDYYGAGQLYTDMNIIYSRLAVVDSNNKPSGYLGNFRIKNNWNGRYISAKGEQNYEGGGQGLWNWYNVGTQKWTVEDGGNGTYKLRNQANGRYLSAFGDQNYDGGGMGLWNWYGVNTQYWRIEDRGNGTVSLKSNWNNRCLSAFGDQNYDGGGIGLYNWAGVNTQYWVLERL